MLSLSPLQTLNQSTESRKRSSVSCIILILAPDVSDFDYVYTCGNNDSTFSKGIEL